MCHFFWQIDCEHENVQLIIESLFNFFPALDICVNIRVAFERIWSFFIITAIVDIIVVNVCSFSSNGRRHSIQPKLSPMGYTIWPLSSSPPSLSSVNTGKVRLPSRRLVQLESLCSYCWCSRMYFNQPHTGTKWAKLQRNQADKSGAPIISLLFKHRGTAVHFQTSIRVLIIAPFCPLKQMNTLWSTTGTTCLVGVRLRFVPARYIYLLNSCTYERHCWNPLFST